MMPAVHDRQRVLANYDGCGRRACSYLIKALSISSDSYKFWVENADYDLAIVNRLYDPSKIGPVVKTRYLCFLDENADFYLELYEGLPEFGKHSAMSLNLFVNAGLAVSHIPAIIRDFAHLNRGQFKSVTAMDSFQKALKALGSQKPYITVKSVDELNNIYENSLVKDFRNGIKCRRD